MTRKTKVIFSTLAGAVIGVIATWALVATGNVVLWFLAWPAMTLGSAMSNYLAFGDDGKGMGIMLSMSLIYFVALGSICGVVGSMALTHKKT